MRRWGESYTNSENQAGDANLRKSGLGKVGVAKLVRERLMNIGNAPPKINRSTSAQDFSFASESRSAAELRPSGSLNTSRQPMIRQPSPTVAASPKKIVPGPSAASLQRRRTQHQANSSHSSSLSELNPPAFQIHARRPASQDVVYKAAISRISAIVSQPTPRVFVKRQDNGTLRSYADALLPRDVASKLARMRAEKDIPIRSVRPVGSQSMQARTESFSPGRGKTVEPWEAARRATEVAEAARQRNRSLSAKKISGESVATRGGSSHPPPKVQTTQRPSSAPRRSTPVPGTQRPSSTPRPRVDALPTSIYYPNQLRPHALGSVPLPARSPKSQTPPRPPKGPLEPGDNPSPGTVSPLSDALGSSATPPRRQVPTVVRFDPELIIRPPEKHLLSSVESGRFRPSGPVPRSHSPPKPLQKHSTPSASDAPSTVGFGNGFQHTIQPHRHPQSITQSAAIYRQDLFQGFGTEPPAFEPRQGPSGRIGGKNVALDPHMHEEDDGLQPYALTGEWPPPGVPLQRGTSAADVATRQFIVQMQQKHRHPPFDAGYGRNRASPTS